ncbi:MAG: VWA domain-containing protein [Planctomycetota bacterium]
MTLLHPLLLAAGLAAIAIPIAIHFFMRRRRQPIAWGAMKFLLEAYQQQRRRLEFEKWLLLALRCLVLALLALGLARPLLGGVGLGGDTPRELYILIDNSLASAAVSDDGTTALERHKEAARAALSELDPGRGDRAALITLASPADAVIAPPSPEPGAVADLIDELAPTDAAADLPGALASIAELSEGSNSNERLVFLLTDWREGAFDAAQDLPRLDPGTRVITESPATDALDNQQITSVRPLRAVVLAGDARSGDAAASAQQVRVELRRLGPSLPSSDGTLALRLDRVRADGSADPARAASSETAFTWDAGQTESTLVIPLPAIDDPSPGLGVLTATLRSAPGLDAIPGDNVVRRVVDVRRNLRVGVIARARYGQRVSVGSFTPADWLAAALDPELAALGSTSPIEPVPVEPSAVDIPRLAGLDAAFVLEPEALDDRAWDNLGTFARRGGLVVLSPEAEPAAATWASKAVAALDLAIIIDPEPRTHEPPLPLATPTDRDLGPLSLLAAELATLSGPVRAFRSLSIEPEPGASSSALRPLLTLADGTPLVAISSPRPNPSTTTPGLVAIIGAAIDPEWTDLPARPLFVPLVQELVRQGVGEARGASAVPAGAKITAGPGATELTSIGNEARPVGIDVSGLSVQPMRNAGAFAVLDAQGAMRTLAIVNPDTRAGRPNPTELVALEDRLGRSGIAPAFFDASGEDSPISDRVANALRSDADGGSPIAWLALLAALVLALAESALARRASHADTERGSKRRAATPAVPRGATA